MSPRAATRIRFPQLPWSKVEGGGASGRMRRHVLSDGGTARILDVYPDWNESEWCRKGHIGYVLTGTLKLEFPSQPRMVVRKGEGFEIPRGCAHRASSGKRTRLFIVG